MNNGSNNRRYFTRSAFLPTNNGKINDIIYNIRIARRVISSFESFELSPSFLKKRCLILSLLNCFQPFCQLAVFEIKILKKII
ncbi:MAG: hypothetical protein IPG09_15225 [Ignavibacteria bacterium]|nr:hypothetical protein [Ignavibacteria bacterium]